MTVEPIVEEVANLQQSQESQVTADDVTLVKYDDDAPPTEQSLVSDNNTDVDIDRHKDNSIRVGTSVRITSNGKYQGKMGIVSRMTEKMVYVNIEGIEMDPRVRKTNVERVQLGQSAQVTSPMPVTKPSTSTTKERPESSSTSFEIGQVVRVTNQSSDYYRMSGTIVKVNTKMLRVSIDEIGEKSLSKKSVVLVPSNDRQSKSIFRTNCYPKDLQLEMPLDCDTGISSISLATGTVTPINAPIPRIDDCLLIPSPDGGCSKSVMMNSQSSTFGPEISIKAGKYKGKTAKLVKTLPRSLRVEIDGKEITVRKTSVEGYVNAATKSQPLAGSSRSPPLVMIGGSGEDWKVPDSMGGGTRWGNRIIQQIRISKDNARDDHTFLSHFLGDRIKVVKVPLNPDEAMHPFDITVLQDGRAYELISVKIREDNDGPSLQFRKKKCALLIYGQIRGPLLEPISIETELSKLADFSALPSARKVVARLELLQSPALKLPGGRPGIFFLDSKDACEIEDDGNDGCGFIDEAFLASLLSNGKYKDTFAIQVRFLAPSMGIFKGMLMSKCIGNGPPIQLTPRMKKVSASVINAEDNRSCLVITQAGTHPSPMNQYIGRMLDPTRKPPPSKSFDDMLKKKPLNKKNLKDKVDMIPRLLLGLGVKEATVGAYLKKSLKMNGLAHAYVVGVTDPTGALPSGCVFVTGFSHVSTPNGEIFVTRSPCTKVSDARMLPMVTNKPASMIQRDWKWLNTLPFGAIIFANPNKGKEPLPAQIANGDLDGDRYFLCWNEDILKQVKTDPIVEITFDSHGIIEDGGRKRKGNNSNYDWLKEAQKLMVDSVSIVDIGALTGSLYKLAEKTADASNLFMRDPDAIAFADAYNQALEFGKHGGKIHLPLHLHDKVPARLRKLLSEPN